MSSLFHKWRQSPLAAQIMVCMVIGIIIGLICHHQDKPIPADDPGLMKVALLKVKGFTEKAYKEAAGEDGKITTDEWGSWLAQQRAHSVDVNRNGQLDASELRAWEESTKLTPAILDAADKVFQQVQEGVRISAKDGYLTKTNLGKWLDALPADQPETIGSVRTALTRVTGGNGKPVASFMAIIGDLFLGLIKSIVVPLVFIAVFIGIAGNDDVATVKKVGSGILVYFLFTTFVAVSIGCLLAVVLQPGEGMPADFREKGMADAVERVIEDQNLSFRDTVKGFIPGNLFQSLSGGSMLEIVLFAALFGAIILTLREASSGETRLRANQVVTWGNFLLDVCMTVVRWAMRLAPLGVLGLMADITAQVGLEALLKLLKYTGTVILGLLCLLVFYSIVVAVVGKRSPKSFFTAIWELQLLAFSTSSSAAVMPRSLDTAENKLGVHKAISRFTIPLGTTINMDGTALYQAVAAVFLMQVFDVPITFGSISVILATAILASIGTPGTPGVGIVVLAGILQANHVPPSGVALIFGVDRILDMCRTAINVTGDQTACIVMEKLAGKQITELEEAQAATKDAPSI